MSQAKVLVVADETTRSHVTPPGHPECVARFDAVIAALADSDAVAWRSGRMADDDELARVHAHRYIDRMREFAASGGGQLDPDTYASPGSFDAACGAAGSGLVALETLRADPTLDAAFVVTRPPGHHATAVRAFGFCFFNNIAIAAAQLASEGEHVAIIDWDVHHGNGTQDTFWTEPDVMYVSLHEEDVFPGTGAAYERGDGPARFGTINLPLPPRTTGDAYLLAMDEIIVPVVERFNPSWVLVSAGFDAHAADPLADMALREQDYALLTDRVRRLAPGPARTVFFLEGGYDLAATGRSTRAVVDTLAHGLEDGVQPTTGGQAGLERVEALRHLWP
jgi:acetoin utilization deacetylase AcuC-like enzyme